MRPVGDRVPAAIGARLSLPLIAAPMLRVSGPDLVVAACRAGVVGAFPTKNARTTDELDAWLSDIKRRLLDLDGAAASFCCSKMSSRLPERRHRVMEQQESDCGACIDNPGVSANPGLTYSDSWVRRRLRGRSS